MEKLPLVSILVLSMNHEKYIEQCIASVLNQTYKNLEIIYLDNASIDNTFLIGKELIESSGLPFKCFENLISKNISTNFNFLFDNSKGSLISPLSADDWFDSENIKRKVDYFSKNEGVGVVFSNGWIYNELDKTLILNDASNFKRGNIYKEVLLNPDCLFYVGILYKREILERVGKWDEMLVIEDTDLFIRICFVSKIEYIIEPLVYYRRLNNSASKNRQLMLFGYRQYYNKYKDVKWINMKNWLGERYRSMAAGDIDEGKFSSSIYNLRYALLLNPLSPKNVRTILYLIRKIINN